MKHLLNRFYTITEIVFTYIYFFFQIGSKASLKLNGQPAVWKIEDTVEEAWTGANDDDIIDDNQLLDENDLKKPDQSSLRGM